MSEYPLPLDFINNMRPLLGEEMDAFLASYDKPSLRGIRFRDKRRPLSADELTGVIPYAKNACYLTSDSTAGAHVLHEAGAYYIQEPSAMTAAAVLAPQDGDRVLDLCAAPGGKSTQLAMSAKLSLLVSNEPIASRAQILSRNIERMGIANAVVTSAYPPALSAKWPGFFDKILVDAPCSGEGMFRRHPETRTEWTKDSPQACAKRQIEILREAAKMLRSGGRMVYSTCTFNQYENEGTVDTFLSEHPDFKLCAFVLPGLANAPDGMLHIWPHKMPGEGHFVALLEKSAQDDCTSAPTVSLPVPDKTAQAAFQAFAKEIDCNITANAVFAGKLLCVPSQLPDLNKLRVLRVGLQLGEMRGKIFLPDHALSLAVPCNRQFDLSLDQAIAYQHGESIPCSDSMRGYYALTYDGWRLGFGKASDGQLKNHYPKGLRK